MPSATFSLFPSARDGAQGHKSSEPPALTSRQSMLDFKRTVTDRQSPIEAEEETQSAGPTRPRTSGDTGRDSVGSKGTSNTNTTAQHSSHPSSSSVDQTSERPFSPESFVSPSVRSTSPTLVASSRCSTSTIKGRRKAPPSSIAVDKPARMRSIFPTYDPDRPLEAQYYLPTQTSPTNIPWEQVCKVPYSPDFFPSEVSEQPSEKPGLLFTPPINGNFGMYTPDIELPALWELSNGRANAVAKTQTYRLQMHRNPLSPSKQSSKSKKNKSAGLEPVITFGPSPTSPFLSVFSEKCKLDSLENPDQTSQRVRIRKHNLARFDPRRDHYADSSILVSDLTIDSDSPIDTADPHPLQEDSNISSITPHKSILDSLSLAGTSSAAAELASVDPGASSVAAANLAERAMSSAKEMHTCSLVYTNVPGTRQRSYALKHPSLGLFRILIEGDVRLHDEPTEAPSKNAEPQSVERGTPGTVKIVAPVSEKHLYDYNCGPPSSRPYKQPTKVLASIDLATSTLSLHGAELTDLNDRYILDSAVSALIGVLFAETAASRVSHLTSFAPPPTKAFSELALKSAAKYKYFPLIRTQKPKKMGKREKSAAEMEESLSVAFGAMVFVLGAAVDGLATWADRVKENNNSNSAPVQ